MRKLKQFIRRKKEQWFGGKKMGAKEYLILSGLILGGLFVTGIFALTVLIVIVSIGLPDVHDLDKLYVSQSTTIYDREGNVLYVKHGGENREYVAYEQISPNIVNATVAIEDDQYWVHSGFDPVGIARAVVNDFVHFGPQQGGSTITQQYIKNAFLSSEKSYTRKLKELILAVQLEQAYDKKKIMELYLNKIPYGNNAYGVEKAANIYFNKKAKDLNLAESSILASMPKGPSYYNPYGPHLYTTIAKDFTTEELTWRNIKGEADLNPNEFTRGLIGKNFELDKDHKIYIQGRTDLVLKAMEKNGYIQEEEKNAALATLQTIKFNEYHEQIKHPHFVFYILDQLEEKYGKELVEQGGLKVYTTLDPSLQESAETIIKDAAKVNEEKYNVRNASLVSIDPKTGQILAMVGSRDYFDKTIDGAVNVAEQYRQPGSSFKPIVYAQAFYNRYAPGTVIFDTETRFGASAFPKDFDGKFRGPITIREGLAQSRNITAIKAYYLAGEQKPIIDLAQRMGVDFLDPNQDYQWPLALGGADVKLTSMVSAFGVFANTGVRHPVNSILKVENADGEVLEEWKENSGEEVLDPQVAYLINNILSDKEVRLGENMTIPGKNNAAKTGTSNRKTKSGKYLPHDLLCIGYTPSLVTGVWAGNNSDTEGDISTYADGYNISAPIWKKFMTEALKDKPSENFPVPDGIKQVTISKATGKLPSPNTPADQQRLEVFASFSVPTEVDNSEVEAEIDTRNNKLSNQYCPPDFVKKVTFVNIHDVAPYPEWEKGALEWIQANMAAKMQEQGGIGNVIYGVPPETESELCNENVFKSKPEVQIIEPNDNSNVAAGSNFDVNVKVSAENGMKKVEYYLDNQYQYFSDSVPYTGKLRLPKGEKSGAHHIITARAIDNFGYSSDATIEVTTGSESSDSGSSKKPPTDSGNNGDPTSSDSKPKESSPESVLPPVIDELSLPTI